jgi:leucyl aminopeptidase
VDRALNGQVSRLVAEGDLKGKAQETVLLYTNGALAARRVLIVGWGSEKKVNLEAIRVAAATAARRVRDLRVKTFATMIHGEGQEGISPGAAAQALVEGTELALYEFRELKSEPEPDPKHVDAMTIVCPGESHSQVESAVRAGHKIAAGVYLTRDLVNLPGNYATPTYLAERAQGIAKEFDLKCQILDQPEIADLGMGAFLGVAQGSDQPPKFIILEHNAGRNNLDTLVLIGKAITFDSGGISIKPREDMDRMKSDMAGGAAVLGALHTAAALELPLHVVALLPATENLPSGKAYKPGDVVRAMNGKTIEVISTDAEGRMVLADALCYAARYDPRAVVDIATLTSARTIALGDHAAGLFTHRDELARRLEAAGQATFERVWRLPLFEEYGERLKSHVADLKHSGGPPGGAITAAYFLSQFAGNMSWAHLDIAGLVSTTVDKPYTPPWATGLGTRLLVQFLRDWAASPPAGEV